MLLPRVDLTLCNAWSDMLLSVKQQGLPVRPWLETFMNSDELKGYWRNLPLQWKGPYYAATMFPDVKGESPDYSDEVLGWAGWIYAHWVQLLHCELSHIYAKAPIDLMDKMWLEYHSIMNPNAVVWNFEHETWRPDAPFLKSGEGEFPYAELEREGFDPDAV